MSCNCHGRSGLSVTRTSPYDQCTACAKKHIVKAWSLFNEFAYADDNRDAMTGQLRLAVDHLMFDHPDTARLARDLAVMLEENRDAEIGGWSALLSAVREDFKSERHDAVERQEKHAVDNNQDLAGGKSWSGSAISWFSRSSSASRR